MSMSCSGCISFSGSGFCLESAEVVRTAKGSMDLGGVYMSRGSLSSALRL